MARQFEDVEMRGLDDLVKGKIAFHDVPVKINTQNVMTPPIYRGLGVNTLDNSTI